MFGDLDRSRTIAYSAAFIGLITLGSWISVPCIPVPFTLQTLFVLLAGAVMKRYAVIPVSLYVILGALGLPLFHNGVAGIGVLLGPTGGLPYRVHCCRACYRPCIRTLRRGRSVSSVSSWPRS